jgi:hypothetical protein
MAKPAWTPAGSSWTLKGVSETTRDAVREAAAKADMLIGEWVDEALRGAAREALQPSPPPATKDDVQAVLQGLAELRANVQALAEMRASNKALAEVKATVQALARRTEPVRPAVRHVMVERKRARMQPPSRGDGRGGSQP